MTKTPLTILILLTFRLTVFSQDLKQELQNQTWYWTGNINDTIPINLYKLKPDIFDYIATFSSTNRLLLTSPNKNITDSIYSYGIKKNLIAIGYELRDSSNSISYHATFSNDKNHIVLHSDIRIKATYPGRDTVNYDYFWLTKERKIRDVFQHNNIIVYSKISDTSNVVQRTKGDFYRVRGDSLFVDPEHVAENHFAMTGRDTLPPKLDIVRIHNITKFYHAREKFNTINGWGIALSVLSALIVSPLVSIQKSGFNGDRYLKVAGSSLAATVVFVSLRVSFSHKRMVIRQRPNSWKAW